jgi:hypothetical protein
LVISVVVKLTFPFAQVGKPRQSNVTAGKKPPLHNIGINRVKGREMLVRPKQPAA